MSAPVAAKRGDLVLVEERRDYGDRSSTYSLERVTSVTRDGWPKVTERYLFDHMSSERFFIERNDKFGSRRVARVYYVGHLLVRASDVDVEAVWAAWLARYDDWRVPPFRSVDEARAFVAPFRLQTPAAVKGVA